MCSSDLAMYDAMFLAFFHHNSSGFRQRLDEIVESLGLAGDGDHDDGNGDAATDPDDALRYSARDSLQDKNFAEFTPAELSEAEQVMASMRLRPSRRRSRRRRSEEHTSELQSH